jgi:hypothetical protein
VFRNIPRKRRAVIKDFRWVALATIFAWVAPALADGPTPSAAPKTKAATPSKANDAKTKDKAAEKKPAEKLTFMRVRRGAHEHPVALEIATGHYVSTEGKPVTVDLIGAIHIGDTD